MSVVTANKSPSATPKRTTYNGWAKGDKAKRKGEKCTITRIHFETHPPSVTVKMDESGNEVGTEFEYLDKIVKAAPKTGVQLTRPKKKRKRESFGAFFEERRAKFESNPNDDRKDANSNGSNSDDHNSTGNGNGNTHNHIMNETNASMMNVSINDAKSDDSYDDLRHPPSKKRRKLNRQSPSSLEDLNPIMEFDSTAANTVATSSASANTNWKVAKSWQCSVCTYVQQDINSDKCEVCYSPKKEDCEIIYENGNQNGNNNNNDNNIDDNTGKSNDNSKGSKSANSGQTDSSVALSQSPSLWTCPECTFIQTEPNAANCQVCTCRRPSKAIEEEKESPDNVRDIFTFVTWNVWFREDLELQARMDAIGMHIVKSNADCVALQEVTPKIFRLIQQSHWFTRNKYKFIKITDSLRRMPYFCVLLSKHEFIEGESATVKFPHTQMHRYLSLAALKYKHNKLIVATTHLESPVGVYQGGTKDKFSKERKSQLKTCLDVLSCYKKQFVLLGGDFNWIGPKRLENDGLMQLPDDWQDCWLQLHPNDPGFTYDGKANQMMLHSYRNRLDRILIKQKGTVNVNGKDDEDQSAWSLQSIEMIGQNQIGDLTYCQKCNSAKQGQYIRTLPVLPSDHYGLCAKFVVPRN